MNNIKNLHFSQTSGTQLFHLQNWCNDIYFIHMGTRYM